jgi:hypothetical protein
VAVRIPPALQCRPDNLNYSDKRSSARADKGEPQADGPGFAIRVGAGRHSTPLRGQVLHAPDKTVPNDPSNKNDGHEENRRRMTRLLRQNEK